MSGKMNFNDGWSCCHRTRIDNDPSDLQWFPLELPHLPPIDEENSSNNRDETWWYRKQFQCIDSEQTSIYLTFQSYDDNNKDHHHADVWLNAIKIYSGPLFEASILLWGNLSNVESINIHTLLIRCMKNCLSLNLYLIKGNIRIDNDISGYVSSINDIDEHFNEIGKKKEMKINGQLIPRLTIVMLIVGTRGDVQPFIAYGKVLREFGHRVRLATHEKFRSFIRENGLEYYPLGGDPDEIMSFMVENSGIIPSLSTIIKGNLFSRRRIFTEIMNSTWFACINDDDQTGRSFRAEVIIANPLSYGHIHCAEKLQIPFHMVFTMPSSPTMAFPHPLSKINSSKEGRERLNLFSYHMVETFMWLGIGDLINKFRRNVLNLPSMNIREGVSMIIDQEVPFSYCWSPSVVEKPLDWPFYIDVEGYFFLDLAKDYTEPPEDLLSFLGLSSEYEKKEMSPPIFIGFGSITGHDSNRLLKVILDALMQTGYRALISGFNTDDIRLPKSILKIDDVPFDWLFEHVSSVCHHGGCGTTGAGLRGGVPTIILPFFGDQFFWGNVIYQKGVGPRPIPGKDVTVQQLIEAFHFVQKPEIKDAAKRLQQSILKEDGCATAMRSFHANLPLSRMRSDLESTYVASFRLEELNLQISRPVAQVLLSAGVINQSQLQFHPTQQWNFNQHKRKKSNVEDRQDINSTTNKSLTDDQSNEKIHRRRNSINTVGLLINNVINTFNAAIDTSNHHQSEDISMLNDDLTNNFYYSPEVCEQILLEFNQVKRQSRSIPNYISFRSNQSNQSNLQRHHSLNNL